MLPGWPDPHVAQPLQLEAGHEIPDLQHRAGGAGGGAPGARAAERAPGSVELYGDDPEVEVYGPVLPENYVTRSTRSTAQSVIVRNEDIVDDTVYVYASRSGKGYHLKSCEYYYDGSQKLTVYEAYYMGYIPCSSCNPPIYTGGVSQ